MNIVNSHNWKHLKTEVFHMRTKSFDFDSLWSIFYELLLLNISFSVQSNYTKNLQQRFVGMKIIQ